MKNTMLIIEALRGKQETIAGNPCCICGGTRTVEKWYDRKKVISSSFTDWGAIHNIHGYAVCSFCAACIGGDLKLRNYSFKADQNGFEIIKHKRKWHYLWDYNFKPPYVLAFTTTHKKHISFKAKIGRKKTIIRINTETGSYDFDRSYWIGIKEIVQDLYDNGITKAELLECSITRKWYPEILQLKKYKDTVQYKLIIDCVQKIEGEEQCELK